MSPTCPECGEEIDCEDCEGRGGEDPYEWVPKAFRECEETTLKPFKELAEKWRKDSNRWVNTYCAGEIERVISDFKQTKEEKPI